MTQRCDGCVYTPAANPTPKCDPGLSPNTGPAIVSSPSWVTVPDSRPACRNWVVTHEPRNSTDTSEAPSCVRPAGFANVAVASSAKPANAPPTARLLAPGFRKSNCSG